jgi:hypothetical protein
VLSNAEDAEGNQLRRALLVRAWNPGRTREKVAPGATE